MRSLFRFSLWIILSGLLFSPAEGVCLLPFPHAAFDNETCDPSVNSSVIRYQPSVRRIGKDAEDSSGIRRHEAPPQSSVATGFALKTSPRRLESVVSGFTGFDACQSINKDLQSGLKTRPPPLA